MRFPLPLIFALVLSLAAMPTPAQPENKPADFKIDPTFIDLPETTFAGVAAYAPPASPRFPELWKEGFHEVMGDTSHGKGAEMGLETEKYAYGLELFPPSFMEKRKFTYMACHSVTDPKKVPLHLLQHTVPASKYAVFKVPGGLDGLGDTFAFIYSKWLPASKYVQAFPLDMERYDLQAHHEPQNMVVEVLVPIVERK